jgi:hypothetical protein
MSLFLAKCRVMINCTKNVANYGHPSYLATLKGARVSKKRLKVIDLNHVLTKVDPFVPLHESLNWVSFFLFSTLLNYIRTHAHTHTHGEICPGWVIRPTQKPQPFNTKHLQETDIHVCGGVRTRNSCERAVPDPFLRPRDHWDQQS